MATVGGPACVLLTKGHANLPKNNHRNMSSPGVSVNTSSSSGPVSRPLQPKVRNFKGKLQSKSTKETPTFLPGSTVDDTDNGAASTGQQRLKRPNTSQSVYSSRSSYNSQQGSQLPEKELLHRFRHVYAGKGGWLHGSRASGSSNVTPTTATTTWGAPGQRYRQEILRKLAKNFSKSGFSDNANVSKSTPVVGVKYEESQYVVSHGQQKTSTPSSVTTASPTYQLLSQPSASALRSPHRFDINKQESSSPQGSKVASSYKTSSFANSPSDVTSDNHDRDHGEKDENPRKDQQSGGSSEAHEALTNASTEPLHQAIQEREINDTIDPTNRLNVEEPRDSTSESSECTEDISRPQSRNDQSNGENSGLTEHDGDVIQDNNITSTDNGKSQAINESDTLTSEKSLKAESPVMDSATTTITPTMPGIYRTQTDNNNTAKSSTNNGTKRQTRSTYKVSHSQQNGKKVYSRRSLARGRDHGRDSSSRKDSVDTKMTLFSYPSVEAQKALDETREEMDTTDNDNVKANPDVPDSLLEINKLLVQRMNCEDGDDEKESSSVAEAGQNKGHGVPDLGLPQNDQLPTSSHERTHRKTRDHHLAGNATKQRQRIAETQVSGQDSEAGQTVKQKQNLSLLPPPSGVEPQPVKSTLLPVKNRLPKTGRLPQITSIDTTKLPRESEMTWKGNNLRMLSHGYNKGVPMPYGLMTKEHTFVITPAGYDSRFSEMPLPQPADDTPHEVKVKAISKCNDWMNKYM